MGGRGSRWASEAAQGAPPQAAGGRGLRHPGLAALPALLAAAGRPGGCGAGRGGTHLEQRALLPVNAVPVLLVIHVALARHHHHLLGRSHANGHADRCGGGARGGGAARRSGGEGRGAASTAACRAVWAPAGRAAHALSTSPRTAAGIRAHHPRRPATLCQPAPAPTAPTLEAVFNDVHPHHALVLHAELGVPVRLAVRVLRTRARAGQRAGWTVVRAGRRR